MLRVATTFSGGFGSVEFALKYENIPHEIVFACEWMEPQRKSYVQNHGEPTSEFYRDIRDLDGTKYQGQIDLLHQSPPCTSYSMAGKREGANSESGSLMWEAIRLIDEVQPKMFTIENVSSLTSSNGGDDWKNIMTDLRKLNYSISYGKLNAKFMGTPQNRDRLFIVGFRADVGMMPFPSHVPLQATLADLLEVNVNDKYYLSQKLVDGFIAKDKRLGTKYFKPTINSDYIRAISARYHKTGASDPYISELKQVGNIDQQGHNSLCGRVYEPTIATTQNANGGGDGAKTWLYAVKSNTKKGYEEAKEGDGINYTFKNSKTRRGRVQDGISHTIDTSCNIATIVIDGNEYHIRRLTPREGARAMGDFDDRFILDGFSDTKLYEFIGNAIDISTYRRLLNRMMQHTKNAKWNDPNQIGFKIQDKPKCNLFELEVVA